MGDVVPVTDAMLVGRLRKALSYQFANEVLSRPKRVLESAAIAREQRSQKSGKAMKFLCEIPTREVFRIEQEVDKDFFKSVKNIRKLIQEEPAFKGGVGV
jgi:hypothetical protein